ncbi:MAG: hypothetical protein AAFO69_16120, partial [Bacteroidota bacterium]
YDASGRFKTKITDIYGLETTYTYDGATGDVATQTSPYGQTTTYTTDGWQRLIEAKDYLNNATTYEYRQEALSGEGMCFTKLVDYPNGKDIKQWYNDMGFLVLKQQLGLNGQWKNIRSGFDVIGRVTSESEPYLGSSPSQWNTTNFDGYGRVTSKQFYTGQVVTTSYNGLQTTVDDGIKTITTTKDIFGNIITLQDPGGTINYTYHGNGELKSADYGSHTVSTTIDGWGHRVSLTDPAIGTISYRYNILGEITQETTPKGVTTTIYDSFGRVSGKVVTGDRTNLSMTYTYDATNKQLKSIAGLNQRSGTSTMYNYDFFYDSQSRLNKVTEQTDHGNFEKRLTYNSFEKVETEHFITTDLGTGTSSSIRVKNVYDDSGILEEVRNDFNNDLLWKLNSENARSQQLNVTLGNGITQTRQYNNFGFVTNMTDEQTTTGGVQAMKLDYDFDENRGNLSSRKNYAFTNWNESFVYDNLDRLTTISGPANRSHDYDQYGRITLNSNVGTYAYAADSRYQLQSIDLNDQGDIFFQGQGQQVVTFNAFKKPVEMSATGNGKVSMEYSPLMSRAQAYYGGDQEIKQQRRFHKQYAGLVPVEIVNDHVTGGTKIITYIAGDQYTAPIAHIKRTDSQQGNLNEYHYLHRDYLGSILAITNESGQLQEERQFGAWGTVDNYRDHLGNSEFSHLSLIGRGYTGHEHFFEVGLIHMNGRL